MELLKSRRSDNRGVFDLAQRRRLMKIGAEFGHAAHDTCSIVGVKTHCRRQQGNCPAEARFVIVTEFGVVVKCLT